VVEAFGDEFINDVVDLSGLDVQAGGRVGLAAEGDFDGVVVAVASGVGAFAEGVGVLFLVPVGVPEFV